MSVRISVESLSGCAWNGCPSQRGIRSQADRQHYHLLILLNRDAYYSIGRLGSERVNMISRIEESWARALGLHVDHVRGLVHIPKNAEYRIDRVKRRDNGDDLDDLFKRASYLCKKATKHYGDRQRSFDTSRV